jgi:hypothetical protein
MKRIRAIFRLLGLMAVVLTGRGEAEAAPSEIKLDQVFLSNILSKVPRSNFADEGKYRGFVDTFRFVRIDPKDRLLVLTCNIEGEFNETAIVAELTKNSRVRTPLTPSKSAAPAWRKFQFEARVAINMEPGGDGTPRLRFKIEDVKRRELTGMVGPLAKIMGRGFDSIVTSVADKKANAINDKLNAEVIKRVSMFRDYGMLCGVDYSVSQIVMLFDVTRLRSERIEGYVFATQLPGTTPLFRWVNIQKGDHFYTTSTHPPDPRSYRLEGISCFVMANESADTVPLLRYRSKAECFYTQSKDVESFKKVGYRLEGIACFVHKVAVPGSVPLYRFIDPAKGLHFYSTHPQAEFAK